MKIFFSIRRRKKKTWHTKSKNKWNTARGARHMLSRFSSPWQFPPIWRQITYFSSALFSSAYTHYTYIYISEMCIRVHKRYLTVRRRYLHFNFTTKTFLSSSPKWDKKPSKNCQQLRYSPTWNQKSEKKVIDFTYKKANRSSSMQQNRKCT